MDPQEKLKDSFISGLILLTPFILTVVVIKLFLGWTSGLTDLVVQTFEIGRYTGQDVLVGQLLVLSASAVLITLTGAIVRSSPGKKAFGEFGRLVNIVPLYRTLYFSFRHFTNALVENRSHYKNAVVVEYPEKDIYRIGFTTSKSREEVQQIDDRALLNIFIPNSPNPTAGVMAIMPEERVHKVDLSVREAFKLVMTTGISNEKVEKIIPDESE